MIRAIISLHLLYGRATVFNFFIKKEKVHDARFSFLFFRFIIRFSLFAFRFSSHYTLQVVTLYKSLRLPVTLVNTLALRVSEYLATLNKHHEVVLGELNSSCPIEFLAPDKNDRTLQDRVLVGKDR